LKGNWTENVSMQCSAVLCMDCDSIYSATYNAVVCDVCEEVLKTRFLFPINYLDQYEMKIAKNALKAVSIPKF
jgi:hypothetical protein